jgi:hypothetical protein
MKVEGTIVPLRNMIIASDMEFGDEVLKSGIIIQSDNRKTRGIRPRWCKVFAVGPKQTEVTVGQWICVEHGRWGRTIELDVGADEPLELRVVDPNAVMLISDKLPDDITLIKKG